jgi:hypothetical protein
MEQDNDYRQMKKVGNTAERFPSKNNHKLNLTVCLSGLICMIIIVNITTQAVTVTSKKVEKEMILKLTRKEMATETNQQRNNQSHWFEKQNNSFNKMEKDSKASFFYFKKDMYECSGISANEVITRGCIWNCTS